MQDERLYVKQPQGRAEHRHDNNHEESSRARVTKNAERGRTECSKVGQGTEGCRGDPSDRGIDAAEDSRATPGRTTDKVVAGEVRHGEIGCISQPSQRDDRRDGRKNYLETCSGHLCPPLVELLELLCPMSAASIASRKRSAVKAARTTLPLTNSVGVF